MSTGTSPLPRPRPLVIKLFGVDLEHLKGMITAKIVSCIESSVGVLVQRDSPFPSIHRRRMDASGACEPGLRLKISCHLQRKLHNYILLAEPNARLSSRKLVESAISMPGKLKICIGIAQCMCTAAAHMTMQLHSPGRQCVWIKTEA